VRRAAFRWISCAAIFIAWNFLPLVSNEQRRVEAGFLVAAAVLFVLLWWVYSHPRDLHPEDVPAAGSTEELETQLAMMDDNV
jgi:hypothetical protein